MSDYPGRSKGQRFISLPIKVELLTTMDAQLPALGYPTRSQFVRDAICYKLEKAGFKMDRQLAQPPPRAGKGGPRKRAAEDGLRP